MKCCLGWQRRLNITEIYDQLFSSNENDYLYFLNILCLYLLVSSLVADMANSSFKMSVASRASQCQGICWWPIGLIFVFRLRFFSSTDSIL